MASCGVIVTQASARAARGVASKRQASPSTCRLCCWWGLPQRRATSMTRTEVARDARSLLVRAYRNIWGSNAGQNAVSSHKNRLEHAASPKIRDDLETCEGGWRLDWEEEGRWVEWRLDEQSQSSEDRFRVVMEWTRFRDARGRSGNLWDEEEKTSGFSRGSSSWWREQYYEYEYAGANGISSMGAVKEACQVLGVSDAGDAGAVRARYLHLVNKWHPDRFHHHTAEEQSNAAGMFRKVQAAYEMLKERDAVAR